MKNWKRTLLIGFVWGCILFGWWTRGFMRANWEFDIFSLGHWQFLLDEYQKGWAISSTSDWVFVSLLFFIPIMFVVCWRYALEIKWMKLLHKVTNKIIYFFTGNSTPKQQVKLALNKNSSKNTRPKAMDSSVMRPVAKNSELKVPVEPNEISNPMGSFSTEKNTGFSASIPSSTFGEMGAGFGSSKTGFSFDDEPKKRFSPPADSPFNSPFAPPSVNKNFSIAQNPTIEDDFDKILLEDIKLPTREPLEENIEGILTDGGYQIIPNAKLGDIKIDYLAVGKDKILICKVDTETGDWLSDEEKFNGEDPLWFSESSHRISPVFNLTEETKRFTERLKTFGYMGNVEPIFIVKDGTIINAEDMIETWKEMNVTVCRTHMGGPEELLSFGDSVLPGKSPDEETMAIVHNAL